jgi:hypothetical protein
MLTELSVVEQHYLAVREVLDGAKVTDVATRYGVDRRTVHRCWGCRAAARSQGASRVFPSLCTVHERGCRARRRPDPNTTLDRSRVESLR